MASSNSKTSTGSVKRLPPMTIKIICIKETMKVTQWNFTEGGVSPKTTFNNTVAAVSDGATVIKFTVFKSLASQIKVGKTYTIRHYGTSKFGTMTMLTNQDTAVYMSAPIEISEELEAEGRRLLYPASILVALNAIGTGSYDHYITIKGWVSAIQPVTQIGSGQGAPYPMRTLHVTEEESDVKITLWREAVLTPLRIGTPLTITHLKPQNSQTYGFSLHTSTFTEVKLESGLRTIKVLGYRAVGEDHEVLDSDGIAHIIPGAPWLQTFPETPEVMPSPMGLHYKNGVVEEIVLP